MLNTQQFTTDCERIRSNSPLVLNLTNYVAMNISANALLAIGASPIMSFYEAEIEELVASSSSILINIGCLDEQFCLASLKAAQTANRLNKPWVLDPVGVGASSARTILAAKLIEHRPGIIRANSSEILCLNGENIASKGVDSTVGSADAVEAALRLAEKSGAIVSMSGARDYITDGKTVLSVSNGCPKMPSITAMGCTASAITAAFVAVENDKLLAAHGAMAMMGLAAELACAGDENIGTGSLQLAFIDELSRFNPEEAAKIFRQ